MNKDKLVYKVVNGMWLMCIGAVAIAVGFTKLFMYCGGYSRYLYATCVFIGCISIFLSFFYAFYNLLRLGGTRFRTITSKPKRRKHRKRRKPRRRKNA